MLQPLQRLLIPATLMHLKVRQPAHALCFRAASNAQACRQGRSNVPACKGARGACCLADATK